MQLKPQAKESNDVIATKESARRQPGAESQLASYRNQLDSQPTAGLQEIFSWLPLPGGRALRWLLDQGVPFDSLYCSQRGMGEVRRHHLRFRR